jgi:hypothetical protein
MNRTTQTRLGDIEARLTLQLRIIAVYDAAEAERVRATATDNTLIVIAGVPR